MRYELRNYHFDINDNDSFYTSGKILSKIFEYISKRENDVEPENIEENLFVQDTDIIFLQEVGNKCPLCNKNLKITKTV